MVATSLCVCVVLAEAVVGHLVVGAHLVGDGAAPWRADEEPGEGLGVGGDGVQLEEEVGRPHSILRV